MLGGAGALLLGHAVTSHAAASPGGLAGALLASGPHPSLGREAETYGRFAGRWRGTYRLLLPEGTRSGRIAVTFGWVLEGRAIQDSGWMLEGLEPKDGPGSTLRFYDPGIKAWRILFVDPVNHIYKEMVGRRVGDDVIQQGYSGGRAIKWTFTEVTARSFTWRGYHLADDGDTWVMVDEYRFERVAEP